jgi:hypothetical protein
MCAGLITAFTLSQVYQIDMKAGDTKEIMGHRISFFLKEKKVTISDGKTTQPFIPDHHDKPLIFHYLSGDLYIAIIKFLSSMEIKGSLKLEMDSSVSFEDLNFRYSATEKSSFLIYGEQGDSRFQTTLSSENPESVIETISGGKKVRLQIIGEEGKWLLLWVEPDKNTPLLPPVLIIEAATRPFIYLIYLGSLLIITTMICSIWRKRGD